MPNPVKSVKTAAIPTPAMLGLKSGHAAIVGLQWGDEGKGKVVDMVASAPKAFDFIARYNGGANAGHTVVVGKTKYALHLLPSGILSKGKVNVVGNGVVIDPAKLVEEVEGMRAKGVKVDAKNLKISDRAHVVFPWHKAEDKLLEASTASPIGTTGRGIGPCYADKALRVNAIRMGDLIDPVKRKAEVTRVAKFKNTTLASLAATYQQEFTPVDVAQLLKDLEAQLKILAPMVCDTAMLLNDASDKKKRILFEGANATLLDIDHGTYPFVTSSNCSSLGVHTGTGMAGHKVPHVIGICKAYQTRVGSGPMPTELKDATGDKIREIGREYGTTTGRPRRCGWLDLVALKYTATVSGATCLCIMLLDVLESFDSLKVCVAYKIDGKKTTRFPASAEELARAVPVYKTVKGLGGKVCDTRKLSKLPAGAKAYLKLIEDAIGVPVVLASVGPARDQTAVK